MTKGRVCPRCGGEFRPEIETCPDCDATLAEGDWAVEEHALESQEASVVVLRTSDPGVLALAQSVLAGEGVRFAVTNERMVGLFPVAFGAPTLDRKYRAAEIEVLASSADRARDLLAELADESTE